MAPATKDVLLTLRPLVLVVTIPIVVAAIIFAVIQ